MLHKSDKGVMGWKNNEQSYKIIVHKHTSTYHKRHTVNAKKKKSCGKQKEQHYNNNVC